MIKTFHYFNRNKDPHTYKYDYIRQQYFSPTTNEWYPMTAEYFDFQVFNKVYVVEAYGK